MKFSMIATLATVAALTVAAPAMAQMSSSSGSMSSGSMSNSMTCQQMMDKAGTMAQPTDANKKMMATKEMDMAKTDMAAGKEMSCKKHMKNAMGDMM